MTTYQIAIRLTENVAGSIRSPREVFGMTTVEAAKPSEAAKMAREKIAAMIDTTVFAHVAAYATERRGRGVLTFKSERWVR